MNHDKEVSSHLNFQPPAPPSSDEEEEDGGKFGDDDFGELDEFDEEPPANKPVPPHFQGAVACA